MAAVMDSTSGSWSKQPNSVGGDDNGGGSGDGGSGSTGGGTVEGGEEEFWEVTAAPVVVMAARRSLSLGMDFKQRPLSISRWDGEGCVDVDSDFPSST